MRNLFLLLLSFFTASVSANVVINGDMEKGVKPWQPYRGNWREPYCPVRTIPCNDPEHGKYAMLVEATGSVRAAGISCEVKLPAGEKKFYLSTQIKLEAIQNGWVQIVLERRVKTADGKQKRTILYSTSTVPTHRGGGVFPWKDFGGEFNLPENLPAGRDFLILRFGGAKVSGRALFDNVVIETASAKSKPAAENLKNAKPSKINLIREYWSTSTYPGCVPLKNSGHRFTADIPAGQRSVWNYTVYSIYDNIQGPMRFSFKSRYPLKAVLRSSLFPTEKKNDVVHRLRTAGQADADGYKLYLLDFTPLPRTGRINITLEAGNKKSASKMDFKDVSLERLIPVTGKVSLYKVWHGEIENQGLFLASDTAHSRFQFENASLKTVELPIKITVSDLYGSKCFDAVKKFILPPQSITEYKVNYPASKKNGFYSVAAQWSANNIPANYRGGFVVVEKPLDNPDCMFSFSAWDSNLGWENIKAQRLIGSGLKASAFFGRYVESGNFQIMEKTLAAAEACNMKVVGTIILPPGRFMPKFKPDPVKVKQGKMPYSEEYFQEAYKRFVDLAKQYKGRIKYWILYDELDCSVLRYPYAEEHFIRAVKTVSNAFRSVDPDVVITSLTVTGHDNKAVPRYPLLRKVWPQVEDYLDGLSLDAYSSGNTFGPNWEAKDPVNGEFKEIVQSAYNIAQSDGKTRLSIQERGYARSSGQPIDGPYAIAEAKAFAADFVLAKSMPELEFLLSYTWRAGNDGPNREFGIVKQGTQADCL